MSEAAEKQENRPLSELDQPQWSVVSFDEVEELGLTYHTAVKLLSDKEAAGVYGLCLITDEAARRS